MIVLASASPRRRELLERAGVTFHVRPAGVDETLAPQTSALDGARELALRKARAGAEEAPDAWCVGSDTIVVLGEGSEETLLGKPEDPREARSMLEQLSGSRHRVITGVSVVGPDGRDWTEAEVTWVSMRLIEEAEIEDYVASGEWRDKAGGYAIQETADRFVTGLEGGGFDNVVGLPVPLTLSLLRSAGAPGIP